MMSEMIKKMMKERCGEDGTTPDVEKMKGFMQMCGKTEFSGTELEMMQKFCNQSGKPDAETLKQLLEKCPLPEERGP